MKKSTKIVWRLGRLPTPDELRSLVADKIITREEAREILFSSVEVEETQQALAPPVAATAVGTVTRYRLSY